MGITVWKFEKVGNNVEVKVPKKMLIIQLVIFSIILVAGSISAGVYFGIVLPNERKEAEEMRRKESEQSDRIYNERVARNRDNMDNEFEKNVSKGLSIFASISNQNDDRLNQNKDLAINMINNNFPTQNDNSRPIPTPQPNPNPKPTQIPPDNSNNRGSQNNPGNFNKQTNSGKCGFDCFDVQSSCKFDCRIDKKCEEQCVKLYQECISRC